MGYYERREDIVKLLECGYKLTLRDLSSRYAVSRKTILNDMTHLTKNHNITVEYGRTGGYYLSERQFVKLNRDQAAAVYAVLRAHRSELNHAADGILGNFENLLGIDDPSP